MRSKSAGSWRSTSSIAPGLAGREHELGVLVAAVGRRAERRQHLVGARLPAPQPDGVEVGVSHHVDDDGHASRAGQVLVNE